MEVVFHFQCLFGGTHSARRRGRGVAVLTVADGEVQGRMEPAAALQGLPATTCPSMEQRASRAWSQWLRPPRPQAWPQPLHRRCRSES